MAESLLEPSFSDLQQAVNILKSQLEAERARRQEAEAQLAKAREALRSLVGFYDGGYAITWEGTPYYATLREIVKMARAALADAVPSRPPGDPAPA